MTKFSWARYGGYECSSKGDKRFSAFNATLYDGRTIEQHYQCDVKGYDIGGTNWRLGKGKAPLRLYGEDDNLLYKAYYELWLEWAYLNIPLMRELYSCAINHNHILSDMFSTTEINQAHALSDILNFLTVGKV